MFKKLAMIPVVVFAAMLLTVAPAFASTTLPLTGGLDDPTLTTCASGWFFVATPVADTTILSISLTFSDGPPLNDVAFTLGPNAGQATVTAGAGLTLTGGSAVVSGTTDNSQFNLSHCAIAPSPSPSPSPSASPSGGTSGTSGGVSGAAGSVRGASTTTPSLPKSGHPGDGDIVNLILLGAVLMMGAGAGYAAVLLTHR
jgi:hypothetical protein